MLQNLNVFYSISTTYFNIKQTFFILLVESQFWILRLEIRILRHSGYSNHVSLFNIFFSKSLIIHYFNKRSEWKKTILNKYFIKFHTLSFFLLPTSIYRYFQLKTILCTTTKTTNSLLIINTMLTTLYITYLYIHWFFHATVNNTHHYSVKLY